MVSTGAHAYLFVGTAFLSHVCHQSGFHVFCASCILYVLWKQQSATPFQSFDVPLACMGGCGTLVLPVTVGACWKSRKSVFYQTFLCATPSLSACWSYWVCDNEEVNLLGGVGDASREVLVRQ